MFEIRNKKKFSFFQLLESRNIIEIHKQKTLGQTSLEWQSGQSYLFSYLFIYLFLRAVYSTKKLFFELSL